MKSSLTIHKYALIFSSLNCLLEAVQQAFVTTTCKSLVWTQKFARPDQKGTKWLLTQVTQMLSDEKKPSFKKTPNKYKKLNNIFQLSV